MTAEDLGVLGDLATALGIMRDGSPDPGWFGDPGERLSTVLSDDAQRDALVSFLDSVLDDGDVETDDQGRTFLPLVKQTDPNVTVGVVLAPTPTTIQIGIRVEVVTDAAGGAQARPGTSSGLEITLFRTGRGNEPAPDPVILLGRPGGRIRLQTRLDLDPSPPAPDDFHLGGIGLHVDVPTAATGDDRPAISLSLTQLQLPGGTPQDFDLGVGSAEELERTVVEFVLGLVRALAPNDSGPLSAVARLIGLTDDLPPLPVDAMLADGLPALTAWLEGVLSDPTTRTTWLGAIVDLLPAGATVQDDTIAVDFGVATCLLGVRTEAGPSGRLRVVPSIEVEVGTAGARVRASLDVLETDLGTGSTRALPRFGVWAELGRPAGTSEPLALDVPAAGPSPAVRVEAVRVGVALDTERLPTFVLAADRVRIGTREYPTLDLTSTDALMDAAGAAVDDILDGILDSLGDVATTVRRLLGITPPPGHGLTAVSLPALASDPLGAVRGYWEQVVADADAFAAHLAIIGEVLADAGAVGGAVEGSGTADDPWRVPLVADAFGLRAHLEGSVLHIGIAATTRVETLGGECTVVSGDLGIDIATIDLAGGHASLLTSLYGRLRLVGRDLVPEKAVVDMGPVRLEADHVTIAVRWAPVGGVRFEFVAPNLGVVVDDTRVPLPLPLPGQPLDAAAWGAVEALIGVFAPLGPELFAKVVRLLGWSDSGGVGRLALVDLFGPGADPADAVRAWLASVALRFGDEIVGVVADLLTGADGLGGLVGGLGSPDHPFAMALSDAPGGPELLLWFPPDGPEVRAPATALAGEALIRAGEEITTWRPGDTGLATEVLATALRREADVASDVADLVWNRDLTAGIDGLVARWTGGDGRIVPPVTAPAGVAVSTIPDAAVSQLIDQLDLEQILEREPPAVIRVRIATNAAAAFPGAPADRVIDLTAANRAPETFTAPAPAGGEWFVALASRAAARLATGDTDGAGGQAARLGRILGAFASLGTGQVVVAEGGAGHAARQAAASLEGVAVSDVITLGTPFGPVSVTVLDEAAAGDLWRLLGALAPEPTDAEDDDLALGRALVAALAELDPLGDPAVDLRLPASGIVGRAGLTVHALFGVVGEPAARRAVTALVAAGLAQRARTRAVAGVTGATGVRLGLRLPIAGSPTDPLVVGGHVTADLGGWDLTSTGLQSVPDRAVRVRLRIGARTGWLAGGPDPLRAPQRSREQALRAVTADVTIPRGAGSTASASARLVLHDGRAFDVARERWDVGVGLEPVGGDIRLMLSLAAGRIVAEATAATPSPIAVGLRAVLESLRLVEADGSMADAVEQLVHDPVALVGQALADEARRSMLASGARQLLGARAPQAGDDPGAVRVATDVVTVIANLASRSISLDAPGAGGRFGWAAHASFTTGEQDWWIRIGTDGTDEAGPDASSPSAAAWLLIEPGTLTLHVRRAGVTAPTVVSLWPSLDVAAAGDTITKVAIALVGQVAIENFRRVDASAKPFIDAIFDAFGLLDTARDAIRSPIELVHDPAGWLRRSGAQDLDAARLVAFVEAFKPVLGLAGPPGELPLAPGVTVRIAAAGSDLELRADVDTSEFDLPTATPAGRLVAGLTAVVHVSASGQPQAALDVFLGLDGTGFGRRAIHVAVSQQLNVFLRPTSGADVGLYPTGPGLGALAGAALDVASHALPFLLNNLAEESGSDLPGRIGTVVATAGDVLGLRDATPEFTHDRLVTFAKDPAGSLAGALANASTALTQLLADALDDAVPTGVTVAVVGGALRVTVGPATLNWTPNPFRIEVAAATTTFPVLENLAGSLALTASGIEAVTLDVGPVPLPAGPVELRPTLAVHAGATPAGGPRLELGLDLDGTRQVAGQLLLDTGEVRFVVLAGGPPILDEAQILAALAEAVAGLAASVALAVEEVQQLLDLQVGSKRVRELLRGVVLRQDDTLDPQVFQASGLLERVVRLLDNLAGANLSLDVGGSMEVAIAKSAGVVGVNLDLTDRVALVEGDVTVWLEVDDDWIDPHPGTGGVTVGLVRLAGTTITFEPSLTVAGVGIRVGRASGPLLDLGVTLESLALHLFGQVSPDGLSGGAQLQLTNLAVAASGASGGNAIASGIVADSGAAGEKPKPAFSPSLAVQKHDGEDVRVTLRAGDGSGPWWVAIQKGFGPLYLEQVGLGVDMPQQRVESISLLLDARVSLFGLNAAVDDLSITYFVADGDLFDASNWKVDLGGLAISAEIGPLSIAGGLLKSGSGDDVEYLGMLLGRFGVYGLTIYGGYGKKQGTVSFFAIGAVVGPIGGPPAFFVTGIGGGFGINRALIVPTDLSRFGDYPLIQALDPGASPPADPMAQLRSLGDYFPTEAGTFWFAAGLSFNSFALVDGVAVVALEFGVGFELSLLGLARMALPRPQAAIVSIELALVVRISSSEGVIWVQAQLTDNSWLLYEDVRLTGGFAYVIWFAGPKRGEFVLTMGGYHPDFHRDGYPQVPRLGLQWSVSSAIVIKGESYFALTSEAIMAGVDVKVSADFGWAWARLSFGAHGIVFFDPFRYRVEAYVRISAGITIDTWFGDITFSVSLGARVMVEGPDFRGKASVEVGPCDVTVKFGSFDDNATPRLTAGEFVPKYLDEAATGVAQAISSIVSDGAIPPRAGGGPTPEPPDGTPARPFVVTAEFVMTVTTTVPATAVDVDGNPKAFQPTHTLGIGPMGVAKVTPTLTLRWTKGATTQTWPFGQVTPLPYGAFPLGVWGPPQDQAAPRVPSGEAVQALAQVQLIARAVSSGGGPAIDYHRLDPPGPRRPLPFLRNRGAARTAEVNAAKRLSELVEQAQAGEDAVALADAWRARAGASAIELASWKNQRRSVPPRLGSLGDRLARIDPLVTPGIGEPVVARPVDATVHPPVALAVLGAGTRLEGAVVGGGTTVSDRPRAKRLAPPTLAGLRNVPAAARLLVGGAAGRMEQSVTPVDRVPVTRAARVAAARVARRGGPGRERLGAIGVFLARKRSAGARVRAGETLVLALPNAAHDVDEAGARPALHVTGCPTRIVMLATGGGVVEDRVVTGDAKGEEGVAVPVGSERIAVSALGEGAPAPSLAGWHSGQTMPYIGWATALATGGTVRVEGPVVARRDDRYRAGYIEAAELVEGDSSVSTRFAAPVDVVVVAIDDPSADAGRRLLLGLEGAAQATGADGLPLPPVALASGNRTFLAYRVVPGVPTGTSAIPEPVTVTVASEPGWHLVGVLGGTGDPSDVLAALAARGLDDVLATAGTGSGEAVVRWRAVSEDRPVKKAAAKKAAAKKTPARKQAAAKKTPANKKAAAKKTPANKKAAAKKTPAKQKAAAKKTPAKQKAAAKKTPAKQRASAKKTPAKKKAGAPARRSTKRSR
jgi:large repetitive protein